MTVQPRAKLPRLVQIAIFFIVAGLQPIFLIEKAIKKVRRKSDAKNTKD